MSPLDFSKAPIWVTYFVGIGISWDNKGTEDKQTISVHFDVYSKGVLKLSGVHLNQNKTDSLEENTSCKYWTDSGYKVWEVGDVWGFSKAEAY